MEGRNLTHVTEFFLTGVTEIFQINAVLFGITLLCYLITVVGNICIMTVVIGERQLHTPMYFLLANLSFVDIGISSDVVPKLLAILLLQDNAISYEGCITQLYFFHFLGGTEAMLLVFMSYDRYVAICHPLQYVVIISGRVCILLASCAWTVGFFYAMYHTTLIIRLPFCSSNLVSHFFCDVKPLLKLVCADTYMNERLVTIITGFLGSSSFCIILVSYAFITFHIVKMKSTQGRQRAFSTCASHLTVVFFFLGTGICTYSRPPTDDSLEQDRMAAILFTVISPTLNPFVYTLRNKEVKRAMRKTFFGYPV